MLYINKFTKKLVIEIIGLVLTNIYLHQDSLYE